MICCSTYAAISTPEEGLEGWPATGMWYLVTSILEAWALPQDWHNVSGAPDTVARTLRFVGDTLEKPSAPATVDTMGWVFLSTLEAVDETALYEAGKLQELQERLEALEVCVVPWKMTSRSHGGSPPQLWWMIRRKRWGISASVNSLPFPPCTNLEQSCQE